MMNNLSKQFTFQRIIVLIILVFCMAMLLPSVAQADSFSPSATLYQSKEDNGHAVSSSKVSSFGYGTKIGAVILTNIQAQGSAINGFTSYLSNSPITIGYPYNGIAYQSTEKDKWHLVADSGKVIAGVDVSEKIKMGTLIIQMSDSGKTWGAPIFEVDNLFTDKKLDIGSLYTISKEDLKQGKYIRVTVAYEMERMIGKKSGLFGGAIYDYLYCTEVYQFYTGFNGDPVQFRDIITGKSVRTDEAVQSGFIIDKNGSSNTLRIKRNTDDWTVVQSLASITEAGQYKVEVTTPLGEKYTYNIEVTDGIKTVAVKPAVYENNKKDKYVLENQKHGTTSFGVSSLSSLTVAQTDGMAITTGKYGGRDAYGITGSSVYLFLNLNNTERLRGGNWKIIPDTWGKKDRELIAGVHTGQVDTGALIIQTSADGRNWINANNGRYARGLHTTDYDANYGGMGDVVIYMPSGEDINKGLFIRVLFVYEIENKSLNADHRCIEKYEFYLCSDNLDAVTFHNLSIADKIEESFGELEENEASVYRMAETMQDGDYTVSGFTIDLSGNPTASYKVKRNGEAYTSRDGKYSETGRYEIEIASKVGSKRNITLFVDSMNTDEALSYYFGDPLFISGKRIYSEGCYPRYEGGHTQYSLEAVDNDHLPLGGYILNTRTLEKTEIPATREAKTGVLTEAGTYEAVFATREEGFESGDRKIFTFRFEVIAEGTAPGPVINKAHLYNEYARSTVSDSYPKYYGLTYPSASKGNITLAFATREAAVAYAMNYEQGMVEKQNDGSYRYTGSFITKQKEKYDSNWDLMDAIEYFANQAVQELYFDHSEEFSVRTLSDDVHRATENLRTLELNESVVIFAEGQKDKLTALSSLPFISNKPCHYLTPGASGTAYSEESPFMFNHDKDGYDSDSVVIIDSNGKEYSIEYNQSVGGQLAALGCPSGVVAIVEKTVYGDAATYDAIYIAEGENTAVINLSCYQKGEEHSYTITQGNDGTHLEVDSIKSLLISDALDPYDLVIVEKNKAESTCVLDQFETLKFEEVGTYTIKIINRLGAAFSFSVDVVDPNFAAIGFTGEGTDALNDVPTQYGAHHVILPVLQREGYNLVGFEDQSGTIHSGEIEEITFRGEQILNAVWKAKQFKATFKNPDGTIDTIDVEYDSQITLPVPKVPEGKEFDGWMVDGRILESNLYTLKSEKDITFMASVSDESTVMRAVHIFMNYTAEHLIVVIAGAAGALTLIILISWVSVRTKRRRRQ